MEKLIKPKREVKISLRDSIESLEKGQSVIIPLSCSESSVRQAASRAGIKGRKYPVRRSQEGFIITRIDK